MSVRKGLCASCCISCNTLHHTATHCNTLQHSAAHCVSCCTICSTLQHTATHCNTLRHTATHICRCAKRSHCNTLEHTPTRSNTLQHTAAHCNTGCIKKHTATHICRCAKLFCYQRSTCMLLYVSHVTRMNGVMEHTYAGAQSSAVQKGQREFCCMSCNTLQHTATHCITLQHTAAHCYTHMQVRKTLLCEKANMYAVV